MKIKLFLGAIIFFMAFFLMSFNNVKTEKNYNSCLERYRTSWGKAIDKCTYSKDIFKADYKNVCNESVDALISLQRTDKKWECFYFENIKPEDTIATYVCKGTGKTLKWVKKAGNTEVSFPTKEEINQMYKE